MKKRIFAALLALALISTGALADFADVDASAWYAEAVAWAEENGVMDGVAEGEFNPDGVMTRAMVVTILYRLAGEPELPESDWGYPYSDVDASAWYALPVYWARLEGIAGGVSDAEFAPGGNITREQLVTMLHRFAGSPGEGGALDFADAESISPWAVSAVAWAAANGVVSGREGNVFDPAGSATRAECAAVLMRFAALTAEPEEPEEPEYVPNLDIIPRNSYDADEFYLEDGFLRYGEDSRVGIDVSSHQGEIDWEAVADSGVEFAIIRAGYRGYSEGELFVDPFFFENIEGALENGLDVGVYFFSQALNTEEALEEAEFLLEAVEGYELALPVVFDWERISYDGGRTAEASGVTVTDCAIAFCEAVEAEGYTAMCYGSPNTVNSDLYIDRLLDYPFWLAHYTEDLAVTDYPYHYDIWQYTSDGSVPGIETRVDLNVAIGDIFA